MPTITQDELMALLELAQRAPKTRPEGLWLAGLLGRLLTPQPAAHETQEEATNADPANR